MYAAAGGASIANRRKQKRLQLNKRADGAAPTPKVKVPLAGIHHHQHHPSAKYARTHVVAPICAPSAPTAPSSSSAFHHSVDRRRRAARSQQLAPVSPIHFPISPPPLSLESSPATAPTKSNFPFPPPSILDLRVAPSTSDLQCSGGPGKAAWQGCNRPSPLPLTPISPHGSRGESYSKTKQCEAHRRWMKRNRIRDASYCYGSSGEDDEEDGSSYARRRGEVSAAVNTMLYAGLGTTALGLVISFVGTGEKGFLSPELRLIGPSLLCAGLLCCLLRVLLCLCLCKCGDCRWQSCRKGAKKNKERSSKMEAAAAGVLPTASLLPLQQPPVKNISQQQTQQRQQIVRQQRLQPSPPSPSTIDDNRSCTAPLSLTPSPSSSPLPTPVVPAPQSTPQPPQPPPPTLSTAATKPKGDELLLSPSQLQDGEA